MAVYDALWIACRPGSVEQAERLPFVRYAGPTEGWVGVCQNAFVVELANRRRRCARGIDVNHGDIVTDFIERQAHQRGIVAVDDKQLCAGMLQGEAD